MASVELIDSSQTMFWTSANLYVNYGNVEGDGTGLTNIGALARDFDAQLITTSHLDDDVVASRNIKFQAIVSRNLMENDITMDRFVAKVFDSEHFGVNSISSENIISYSLSFDIISDEISVSDYIPDDFFTSSLIATDQIYATHIQEYSITSKNLQDDIFDGSHFRSNIVMVDHIEDDSITYEKLATDAVQLSSFSGVIPIENGGTGLSAVHSGSVILMGDDQFDSQLNFRLDDSTGYFGLFDSDLSTIFSIVDDSSSVNIRLASTGDSVGVALENSAGLVDFKLDDDGYFNFNVGSSTWYLTEQGIMFDDPALDQYQFNLNSAITIAVAKNNEPNDGTIEFDELYPRFRFYDGSEWDLISTTGYGIGNPKQEGVVDIDVLDSFIGSVAQSNGWIEDSVIHQLSNSSIMGERMSIYRVDGSQIEGSQMMGSMVVDSVLISDDLIVDMSMDSMIRGQKLQVGQSVESELNGTASSVQGIYSSEVLANQSDVGRINDSTLVSYHSAIDMVSDSVVHSKESSLLNLDLVDLDVANSVVLDAAEVVVRGSGHYLDALLDVDVTGDRHSLFQVSFSQVEGYGNRLMNSSHSVVHGDANQVIGDDISIYGDNNLVVGSNQRIIGDGNISFYMGDDYQYIQEDSVVAFHAPNGVYFSTAPGMLVGATEMAGGWEHISDRNLKTGFSDVDHAEIFEQLMNLSISKWEYSFRKGVPHIGPMAQDFWSAFKLGEDERFITATDVDGIAFSAIKYMIDELDKSSGGVSFDTSQFDRFNELIMAADNTLSSLEKSLIMKNDALSVLVDSNLDQYIMLDKQFKVISRFKDVPSYQQLIMDGLVLVFCIIFGIFLGFILMTLYYKNDKGKGRYNGI